MPITFNERFIAYLTLITGLAISAVAVYYSVVGLTAIFAAAFIPIIIMGTILEIGKLVATVWLKQNWSIAPRSIKFYLMTAIIVLMIITSMGIFGFLSKAHLDQGVPTGDVAAKLSLIDEKIKLERDNIDVARKALKQLDEAVDQTMARSTTEQGATRSAQLRRNQSKERTQLQSDISRSQANITALNNERVPIASELRKVEAEVGPIKYIAQFFYGQTDETILEKAVTWVIIILIVVFDPLAVMLLLASQISFENFRKREQEYQESNKPDAWVADVGEKPTAEELEDNLITEEEKQALMQAFNEPAPHHPDTQPYLRKGFVYPPGWQHQPPMVYSPEESTEVHSPEKESDIVSTATVEEPLFIQNEEQKESGLWSRTISKEEYEGISMKKKEELLNHYADLVRTKKMPMSDVPEHLLLEIRARV